MTANRLQLYDIDNDADGKVDIDELSEFLKEGGLDCAWLATPCIG